MEHQKSNSKKSTDGYNLNKEVKNILLNKLEASAIKSYTYEPKYNFPNYKNAQFSPDGEIILNNGLVIIIDNTTSVRHDRLKQKQWDAFGTKEYFKMYHPDIEVKYYVVLPDKNNLGSIHTREKEFKSVVREKNKINGSNYFSAIDDIIHISELIELTK